MFVHEFQKKKCNLYIKFYPITWVSHCRWDIKIYGKTLLIWNVFIKFLNMVKNWKTRISVIVFLDTYTSFILKFLSSLELYIIIFEYCKRKRYYSYGIPLHGSGTTECSDVGRMPPIKESTEVSGDVVGTEKSLDLPVRILDYCCLCKKSSCRGLQ